MKTLVKKFREIIQAIYTWLMCFLTKNCPYSLKKLLAILSFFLVVFLAVFTEKLDMMISMLGFIAALLGLQSIDKYNYGRNNQKPNENLG